MDLTFLFHFVCPIFTAHLQSAAMSAAFPHRPPPPKPLLDLHVTVLSAKHHKNVNWRNGDLKPYAVAYLHPDRRSATKPDDSDSTRPVWNERLTFPLPFNSDDAYSQILTLDVFHSKPSETPKPLVGTERVPFKDLVPNLHEFSSAAGHALIITLELHRPSGRPQGKVPPYQGRPPREPASAAGEKLPDAPSFFLATATPPPLHLLLLCRSHGRRLRLETIGLSLSRRLLPIIPVLFHPCRRSTTIPAVRIPRTVIHFIIIIIIIVHPVLLITDRRLRRPQLQLGQRTMTVQGQLITAGPRHQLITLPHTSRRGRGQGWEWGLLGRWPGLWERKGSSMRRRRVWLREIITVTIMLTVEKSEMMSGNG